MVAVVSWDLTEAVVVTAARGGGAAGVGLETRGDALGTLSSVA